MRKQWIVFVGALVASAAGALACGNDTLVAPLDSGSDAEADATSDGSASADSSPVADSGAADGARSSDAGAGDGEAAAPIPARLLLSYNAGAQSELSVFGLPSGKVDGDLLYPAMFGAAATTPTSPWLLEQSNDVVARLDPNQPWVVQSTWNVALNDETDAGFSAPYADPDAIVVTAGTKAYVLRYTRNLIAVLGDTSANVDGGVPTSTIDLSSQVQAAGDGYVEMTAGYYDPTTQRVYVLLANINRFDVACSGYCQLCSATNPTLVAIDTTTDQLVPLAADGGADGGAGYALQGYAPAFGPSPMVFDSANDRLLVLHAGCNVAEADGGVGPLVRRGVEAVSLADGSTQMLLDLTGQAYPQAIYYVDPHHVVLQLDTAYAWDPSSSTMGPAIPNAPTSFALDAQGNLVGVSAVTAADGGYGGWSVVSVSAGDGGVTTLGSSDPFSLSNPNGFVSGVVLWPAP